MLYRSEWRISLDVVDTPCFALSCCIRLLWRFVLCWFLATASVSVRYCMAVSGSNRLTAPASHQAFMNSRPFTWVGEGVGSGAVGVLIKQAGCVCSDLTQPAVLSLP